MWLHTYFFAMNMVAAVQVHYLSRQLGYDALETGLLIALTGLSGLVVSGWGPRLQRRYGVGRVVTAIELLSPAWVALLAVAGRGSTGLWLVVVAMILNGVTIMSGSLTMGHRTAITPDRLRARMNSTIRTVNWGGIAIAAPLGGWLGARYGDRFTLWLAVSVLVVATVSLSRSRFRDAVMPPADASVTGG